VQICTGLAKHCSLNALLYSFRSTASSGALLQSPVYASGTEKEGRKR